MKKRILIPVILSLLFIASCKKGENNPDNTSKCKLTEISTNAQFDITGTDPGTYTASQKFEYNDKNLLSGRTNQQNNKTKSNKTYTYSSSENFQYNADGFLVKQISQSSSKDYSNVSNNYSGTTNYEYTNNRLTKEARTTSYFDGSKTVTSTANYSYEYNADGKVTKYAYISSSSDGSTRNFSYMYEYTNGILSKLTINDQGVVSTPLIEVNSRGLITKQVNGTQEYRYQYDTEGSVLRTETWNGGKKKEVRVYEYDTKQNVFLTSTPQFRGHPDFSTFYGNDYLATHNLIKDERLSVDGAGMEKSTGSNVFTYQYNSNNLPISGESTYTGSDGKISQTTSVNYTYKDCQ
jgi:hypothetical protein